MPPPDRNNVTPTPMPAADEPSFSLRGQANERLGDYHLLRKLGQGGMGEVFLAKRVRVGGFEKTFAVKRMLDSLAGSSEFVAMFFDEARLAARLDHANIAQIFDFGFADGYYYIALEHIPGEDVSAIISRMIERGLLLPPEIVVRIMMEVCAGLHYAHTLSEQGEPLGIIHRDVSPSNIMVSYQGAVKLLDFGIAKAASRATATRTGNIKGKFLFVAPEQVRGEPIDARVDLFSLGITMFSMLTGQHPYRRDNEVATLNAIANGDTPDVRSLRPELTQATAAVVRKAMAREKSERYQTAAEMGQALQELLNELNPATGSQQIAQTLLELFGPVRRDSKIEVPAISRLGLSAVNTPVPSTDGLSGQQPTNPLSARAPRAASPKPWYRSPWILIAGWAVAGAVGGGIFGNWKRDDHPRGGPATVVVRVPETDPLPSAPPPQPPAPPAPPEEPKPVATRPPKPSSPRPSAKTRPAPVAILDRNSLDGVIKGGRHKFTSCFRTHAAQLPNESGQVRIEIAVAATGRVSATKVSALPASAVGLTACLEETARQLRFPRHADQEVRFAFPLVYRRGE
ncbi:MAG TPA: protein kinase [Polyangia bacterium]